MIENITFYFICLIFALIGLGAIWEKRFSFTTPFILYIAGTTSFVLLLYLGGLNVFQLFDVRQLLGLSDLTSTQPGSRRIMPAIAIVFTGATAYITIIICLFLQLKKRITNRSTTDAPSRGDR